jgi:hypothetical protein
MMAAPALVVLQPGRRDRLALQRVHQVRAEAVTLQQLQQPPPPKRGLERRGRARRQAADHTEDRLHPIGHVTVGEHLASLVDHRHLRTLAVHVDPDVDRHNWAANLGVQVRCHGLGITESQQRACSDPPGFIQIADSGRLGDAYPLPLAARRSSGSAWERMRRAERLPAGFPGL